jgi:lactoylglutathione lyase
VRAVTQILGQFCINVRDIDHALEFWEGVCELELQHRTEIPGVLEAVLQSPHGGSRMQLAQHLERDEPIDMGTAMWKLYVNTSDCQAVYDRAIAAGCESVTEPTTLDRWPVIVAFVKDFDGYLVEFVEHKEGTREGVPDPKAVS